MSKRKTTPESRLACARHAVSELLNWEWPPSVPEGDQWVPEPWRVTLKTTALYSWVEISPEEAAEAVSQVLQRRAEEQSRRDAARWTPEEVAA